MQSVLAQPPDSTDMMNCRYNLWPNFVILQLSEGYTCHFWLHFFRSKTVQTPYVLWIPEKNESCDQALPIKVIVYTYKLLRIDMFLQTATKLANFSPVLNDTGSGKQEISETLLALAKLIPPNVGTRYQTLIAYTYTHTVES